MKKIILFGIPFVFILSLFVFIVDWFDIYYIKPNEQTELFLIVQGMLLSLWFCFIKREIITEGSYSNHLFTSVFVRFVVVASATILFSHEWVILMEIFPRLSDEISLGIGIIAGIISVVLWTVGGEFMAEKMIEVEARMKQREINNIKAF